MFIQKPFALTTTTGGGTAGYTVDDSIWVQTSDSPEIIMPNSDGGGLKWIMIGVVIYLAHLVELKF